MDAGRFDRVTKGLFTGTSRRRVLTGLGGAAAALTLRKVMPIAAQSTVAECQQACNAAAKETRQTQCAALKSRAKNACLKQVQAARATCRAECLNDDTEEDTEV